MTIFFDTKIIYNSPQVEMKKIICQLIKNEIANKNEITFLQQALTKKTFFTRSKIG